jgi:Flp pilus assembly protein TadD
MASRVRPSALKRTVAFTTAWIVAVAVCLSGCQTKEPPRNPAGVGRTRPSGDTPPESFDAAAGKPPTAATMYSLAQILAAQGNITRCVGVLRNLIQSYPDCAPAYNALAEAYLTLDRGHDAIDTLTAGVARHPKDPVLLNNLGMAHFLSDDFESALVYFDRATQVRPEDATYRSNKASALGMLGRNAEAAALFRKHLRQSDVHENVDVLIRARRAAQAEAAARSTTAPSDVQ